MKRIVKSLLLVSAWLALCGFRIVTVAVSGGGGGSSSGAYDLEGEALTCSDTGNVTMTCGDDTTLTVDVNTGGSLAITDGTNTTNLSPSAAGLTIDDALVFGGGADLNGTTLTCSSTGNVSIACADDTSMVANVNTGGSFDITDGTTSYEVIPSAGSLTIKKNGTNDTQLIVEKVTPNDGVFEISTVFDFNTSAATLDALYEPTPWRLTARPSLSGYVFGLYQGGIIVWSDTTVAGNDNGANLLQTTAQNGILVRTNGSSYGVVQLEGVAFASLPGSPNGTIAWCTDCAKATPCAGSGTGAFAKRMNDTWDCD